MVTSQILKSVDFTKAQKSRYLENETWFFLQIKKFINYTSIVSNNFHSFIKMLSKYTKISVKLSPTCLKDLLEVCGWLGGNFALFWLCGTAGLTQSINLSSLRNKSWINLVILEWFKLYAASSRSNSTFFRSKKPLNSLCR